MIKRVILSLVVVLVLVLLGTGAWLAYNNKGDSSAVTGVALSQASKDALTVAPSDILPDAAKCVGGNLLDRKAAIDGPYKWSDSVSIPYLSSDKAKMLKETFAENCTNPVLLDMNVQAIAKIDVAGWNVGAHNPWMKDFLVKADTEGLRTAFLAYKPGTKVVVVTAYDQQVAAMVNTLLTRFQNLGVVTETSVANWHKPGDGLVATELVRTTLNKYQESRPVLKLELIEKSLGCIYAIGFNTGDKRYETLSCTTPTPTSTKPTPTSTTPKPKPTSTKPTPTSTKPTPTSTKPTPTPTSTKPTPTSTTPSCAWPLTNGRCLQPKSSNPKDYVHITAAPKATVNSGPTAPSPVITSQTGGGGVIDSPTSAPGSTSGVVAPGATPAPTTPRDTPPPESGAQPPSTGSSCVPAPGQATC